MQFLKNSGLFFFIFLLTSCGGLQYSQQSADDTQQITQAAILLISKSDEPYIQHQQDAERLKQQVQEIYVREQTRKMNNATVSMWKEVMQGEGNLFALLDLWKTNGTLSPAMRLEATKKIERLLNSIYDLEMHKRN